jgi:hypothetical protein
VAEKYTNNATSTLASGINNSVTSLDVASASAFPSSGNFRIIIDSEIMLVTAVSTNTFTVTRAAEGTAAASHSSGATVSHVLTAGAVDTIRSDLVQAGVYASRPAASKAGNLYLATDGPYLCRDDGSAWACFGPLRKLTPVVTADFSWLNQLSGTETVIGGAVVLQAEASRASPSTLARVKTAPSTPYTVTMAFVPQMKPTTAGGVVNAFCGMIFRESSTGKIMSHGLFQNDGTQDRVVSFAQSAGATGAFATVTNLVISLSRPVWFQLSNDGTNLIWRYSADGSPGRRSPPRPRRRTSPRRPTRSATA